MIETLHFFTTRGWNFNSQNLLNLWNQLDGEDKKVFNFDIRQVNWDDYLFDYIMGIKVYLLKESIDELPTARSNLARFFSLSGHLIIPKIYRLKQVSLYWNAAVWAVLVRLFAWFVYFCLVSTIKIFKETNTNSEVVHLACWIHRHIRLPEFRFPASSSDEELRRIQKKLCPREILRLRKIYSFPFFVNNPNMNFSAILFLQEIQYVFNKFTSRKT